MSAERPQPIKALASFFDAQYQAHVGVRYPFNNGKDAKIIKDLREIYSDADLETYMAAFFEIEDGFIEESGYGLGVFRGCLPKVIQYVRKRQAPTVMPFSWACPHVESHASRGPCEIASKLNRPRKAEAS